MEMSMAVEHQNPLSLDDYRNIIASTVDGFALVNVGGYIIDVNNSYCQMIGYTREELLKMHISSVDAVDGIEEVARRTKEIIQRGSLRFETKHHHKNGSTIDVEVTANYTSIHGGLFFSSVRCIFQQKRAEESLKHSEQKYRLVFEMAGDNISVMTLQGKLLTVNPNACQMLGYTYDELIALSAEAIDAKPELMSENINKLLIYGHYTGETELVSKDGTTVPVTVDARIIEWDGQQVILSICRDITEQKKNLQSLDYIRNCFAQALNGSQHILYRLNTQTGYDYLSPAFEVITGHPVADFKKINREKLAEYFHPDDIPPVLAVIDNASRSRTGPEVKMSFEYRLRKADGSYCWLYDSTTACFNDNDEIVYFFGSAYDITERKNAEDTIREGKELLAEIINMSPISMAIVSLDGTIEQINKRAIETFGYLPDDIPDMERWWAQAYPDESYRAEVIAQWMGLFEIALAEKGEIERREYRITCKDGTVRTALIFGILVSGKVFVMFDDITERKRAEEDRLALERQLLQSQKLESLGVMAGGIAHDFNNLLQSMLGNLELAAHKTDEQSEANKYISYATNSAKKAAHLTDLMLTYAGKGYVTKKNLNMNHLIKENIEILRTAFTSSIALDVSLFSDLPTISAGEMQIQQVIMNLIINAAESIKSNQGHVRVATSVISCDESYLATGLVDEKLKTGIYICLEVTDNGCGMDQDTLNRLFDPFFTTKFTGRGLGMSVVKGVVKSHSGTLFIDSKPGKGTTFRILFPVSETTTPALASMPLTSTKELCTTADTPLSGVLLLVDDEKSVLKTCRKMAELIGFKVITARDGIEALAKYRDHQDEIDVVILDVTMPNMDGFTTMNELYTIRPDVKVILASGYNEDELSERIINNPPSGFVRKPYSMRGLEAELRKALMTGSH
jgi:PAS domain S-box-containing protein